MSHNQVQTKKILVNHSKLAASTPTSSPSSFIIHLLQPATAPKPITQKAKTKNSMEISSICLSPVSTSIPRVTPPSLPFSSSNSTFFASNATLTFFNKTKPNSNTLVLGGATTRTRVERARKGLTCNALFGLGVPELAVIAGVAALVFGPKKLPEVGKSIGKTVKSFQQAAKEFESELKKEPDSITEPPVEKPTAVSEEEKQDIKVSSTKESV